MKPNSWRETYPMQKEDESGAGGEERHHHFTKRLSKLESIPETTSWEPGTLRVVCVGGPIGVGKTTAIDQLKTSVKREGCVYVYPEDVDDWASSLQRFYDNPGDKDMGALLQMQILAHYQKVTTNLMDLAEQCKRDRQTRTAFVERSPLEVLRIFVPENFDPESEALASFSYLCGLYLRQAVWRNAMYVFLMLDPADCMDRINQRDRPSERNIRADYTQRLHERYISLIKDVMGARRINMKETTVLNAGGQLAALGGLSSAYTRLHPNWRQQ